MMTERITRSSVTFLHDFFLRDIDGVQPPGTYLVETVEEPLGTLSVLAYRRVCTTVTLPAIGVTSLRKQTLTSCRPPWPRMPWLRQVTVTESQGARENAPARREWIVLRDDQKRSA